MIVFNSPREAIECFKRALIGADPYETTIHLKLAKLHDDTKQFAAAASYHRRVIDVCQAASAYLLLLRPDIRRPIPQNENHPVLTYSHRVYHFSGHVLTIVPFSPR